MQVALFPIPSVVTFPGQTIPLHIFEPRYRKMVSDCLEEDRELGVACAAGKITKRDLSDLSLAEKLNQNHDTYRAHDVFCAGKVRLDEILDDGRLVITVFMTKRLKIRNFVQTVPYYLCEADELPTIMTNAGAIEREYERLRQLIALLLNARTKGVFEELDAKLRCRPEELLGIYMQLIQIEAEEQQVILELDALDSRIRRFANAIEAYLIGTGLLSSARALELLNACEAEEAKVIPLFKPTTKEPLDFKY